jgi:hypothetical protein
MALIPSIERVRMVEFFKMDCGFLVGDVGLMLFYLRVAFDFFSMSIGTGFIITFEFLLDILEEVSYYFCETIFDALIGAIICFGDD